MTVIGEPGIGKSRLARELSRASRRPRDGARGTLPALRIGHHLLAGPRDGSPGGRRAAARGAHRRPGRRARPPRPRSPARSAWARAPPGEAIPWGFRRLFGAVARDGPLVLLFEDVHWAEPPLLDLVDDLAAQLTDAPVLLLCLARPELLAARPAWARTRPA